MNKEISVPFLVYFYSSINGLTECVNVKRSIDTNLLLFKIVLDIKKNSSSKNYNRYKDVHTSDLYFNYDRSIIEKDFDKVKLRCFNVAEFKNCKYSLVSRTYYFDDFDITLPYKLTATCTDSDDDFVMRTLKYGKNYFFKGEIS